MELKPTPVSSREALDAAVQRRAKFLKDVKMPTTLPTSDERVILEEFVKAFYDKPIWALKQLKNYKDIRVFTENVRTSQENWGKQQEIIRGILARDSDEEKQRKLFADRLTRFQEIVRENKASSQPETPSSPPLTQLTPAWIHEWIGEYPNVNHALSPDESIFVLGEQKNLTFFDTEKFGVLGRIPAEQILAKILLPSPQTVVIVESNAVRCYMPMDKEFKEVWHLPGAWKIPAFLPESNSLITGNKERILSLNLQTGKKNWEISNVSPLKILSRSGAQFFPALNLVTSNQSESFTVFDARNGEEIVKILKPYPRTLVVLSPDGSRIGLAEAKKIRFFDLTGKFAWETPKSIFASLSFSPDGRKVVVRAFEEINKYSRQTISMLFYLLDATTGEELAKIITKGGTGKPTFSPNGKRLLVRERRKISIWNTEKPTTQPLWEMPTSKEIKASFSPDGKTMLLNFHTELYSVRTDTNEKIWGEKVLKFPETKKGSSYLEFSSDGKWFSVDRLDGFFLFETETSHLRWHTPTKDHSFSGFSPHSKFLVLKIPEKCFVVRLKPGETS